MVWIKNQYFRLENSWLNGSRRRRLGIFLCAYTALFLITYLLAYSPFFLGEKSYVWRTDGRGQYYPELAYIGRYLRKIVLNLLEGKIAIPLFDLNIGLGADIIATLHGDPLFLLAAFFPTKYTEYLYNFLVGFRMYLAGLAFCALCVHHKKRVCFALTGALIYVFSGYMIVSAVRHPFFISPMIQFPLLLIGADQIMRKRKPWLFIFAAVYSALCGYYFLYMMTIMLAVYVLVRFFELHRTGRIKAFAQMAGRMIGAYLLGIGMSAVYLLPVIIGYLTSSRMGQMIKQNWFSYGWEYYRNHLFKMIAPPGSWDSLSLAAIVPLALVLLFFQRGRRRSLKLLFAVSVCVWALPLGGYIMSGFAYPSNRWTFGFALLLAYIVVEMLPDLLSLDHRQKTICLSVLLGYLVCVFASAKNRGVYYVVGAAMLSITLVVLLLMNGADQPRRKHRGRPQAVGAAACALLVLGNVSINAVYMFAEDQANYAGQFTKYGVETERLESSHVREAEPYAAKQDGRFDSSTSFRNLGMVWRVPTLSAYWSIINSHVVNYWLRMENIEQRAAFDIYGADRRTVLNTLLSTKYLIENGTGTQNVPYGYTFVEKSGDGNTVYENQYALGWGYTYDSCMSYGAQDRFGALELEEAMLQTIALDEEIAGIPVGDVESDIRAVPYTIKSMSNVEWVDSVLKVNKANAVITLEFRLPGQTEGYLRLKGFDISGSGQKYFYAKVACADVTKSAMVQSQEYVWRADRESFLCNLGYSEEERTTCTITLPVKGTFRLEDIQLFALPMDNYPARVEALRAEPLENTAFGTNRISGTVDLSKNKILCMSIPYSLGWSAKVDGEPVKILRGNYMFMALPLAQGHHEIEFTYCTPGLKAGALLSALSFAMIIVWAVRDRKRGLA